MLATVTRRLVGVNNIGMYSDIKKLVDDENVVRQVHPVAQEKR